MMELVQGMITHVAQKVLGTLKTTADKDAEKYANFWKEFGKIIKEGVVDDHENKEKVAELLRFASTHNDDDGRMGRKIFSMLPLTPGKQQRPRLILKSFARKISKYCC